MDFASVLGVSKANFAEGAAALNANQTHGKILQRGRHGPARDLRAGPRQLATPHGARMADGPLPRLFRDHVDVLHRLAPAFRGRGSPHGRRGAAGGPASFDAGSARPIFWLHYVAQAGRWRRLCWLSS